MVKKDGSEINASLDGKAAHEEDGSFKQTRRVLQDINELKQVFKVNRAFAPQMDDVARDAKLTTWRKIIKALMDMDVDF